MGRSVQQKFIAPNLLNPSNLAALIKDFHAECEAINRDQLFSTLAALLHIDLPQAHGVMTPRLVEFLGKLGDDGLLPPFRDAARMPSLSPQRFSHLFSAQAGIAYTAFAKWRKLLVSVNAVAAGYNLTNAAHEGGFSDAAHFTRTFHNTFGLAPSAAFSTITMRPRT